MMKMHFLKRIAPLLLLLLAIAAVIIISLPDTFNITPPVVPDKIPDWYMKGVTATTFNQQGKIKGILKSPELTHHPSDNTTDLTQPFFIVYDKKRSIWHITSKYGKAYQAKKEKIHLWNNVVVKQLPGNNSNQTKLTTSELTYYPDTSFAHTDKPVTIRQPGSIMHSVGFDANLKKGLIKFLSQSQVEYNNVKAN